MDTFLVTLMTEAEGTLFADVAQGSSSSLRGDENFPFLLLPSPFSLA